MQEEQGEEFEAIIAGNEPDNEGVVEGSCAAVADVEQLEERVAQLERELILAQQDRKELEHNMIIAEQTQHELEIDLVTANELMDGYKSVLSKAETERTSLHEQVHGLEAKVRWHPTIRRGRIAWVQARIATTAVRRKTFRCDIDTRALNLRSMFLYPFFSSYRMSQTSTPTQHVSSS